MKLKPTHANQEKKTRTKLPGRANRVQQAGIDDLWSLHNNVMALLADALHRELNA